MIGMNEALMLAKREDILDEIALALEAFTDDILPAVGESTFTIEPSIPDETSNKLVLTGVEEAAKENFKRVYFECGEHKRGLHQRGKGVSV